MKKNNESDGEITTLESVEAGKERINYTNKEQKNSKEKKQMMYNLSIMYIESYDWEDIDEEYKKELNGVKKYIYKLTNK